MLYPIRPYLRWISWAVFLFDVLGEVIDTVYDCFECHLQTIPVAGRPGPGHEKTRPEPGGEIAPGGNESCSRPSSHSGVG